MAVPNPFPKIIPKCTNKVDGIGVKPRPDGGGPSGRAHKSYLPFSPPDS